jgi:hypothetical protein
VKNGDVITVQLRDYQGLDDLNELCDSILLAPSARLWLLSDC